MEYTADSKCEKCGATYISSGWDSPEEGEGFEIFGPSCECWLNDLLEKDYEYIHDYFDEEPIEPYCPDLEPDDYDYGFDEGDPEWIAANDSYGDALKEQAAYQHYLVLKQKYWIGDFNNPPLDLPIYRILMLLEDGQIISELEINWLISIHLYVLAAHCYWQNFRLQQNGWDHVMACKFYRRAGYPQLVIDLTNNFFPTDAKIYSYSMTNRGGVFRDHNQMEYAIACAYAAIRTMPNNCGPYMLLGGIYFQLRDFDKADYNFRMARHLGARLSYPEDILSKEFQGIEPKLVLQAVNFFLQKDPVFYTWMRRYLG